MDGRERAAAVMLAVWVRVSMGAWRRSLVRTAALGTWSRRWTAGRKQQRRCLVHGDTAGGGDGRAGESSGGDA